MRLVDRQGARGVSVSSSASSTAVGKQPRKRSGLRYLVIAVFALCALAVWLATSWHSATSVAYQDVADTHEKVMYNAPSRGEREAPAAAGNTKLRPGKVTLDLGRPATKVPPKAAPGAGTAPAPLAPRVPTLPQQPPPVPVDPHAGSEAKTRPEQGGVLMQPGMTPPRAPPQEPAAPPAAQQPTSPQDSTPPVTAEADKGSKNSNKRTGQEGGAAAAGGGVPAGTGVPASIAAFVRDGSWTVPAETPEAPHPQLLRQLFGSGDSVPEGGCEGKWGNTWLRMYEASRSDVCKPDEAGVKTLAAAQPDRYKPRAGPFAWESSGWSGEVDSEYGVKLGTSTGGGQGSGPAQAPGRVTRWTSTTGSHFEWMRNVAVDFGRKSTNGNDHHFSGGFLQVACNAQGGIMDGDQGAQPAFRALEVVQGAVQCDSWVHTPTMVLQHEDIGNTYHNLGDFWRAWIGMTLLSSPMCVPTAEASGDPTRTHGPKGALREGDGTDGYTPSSPSCPSGHTRIPGLDPDHMQFMTLDARLMCGTIDIHGRPIDPANREDCFGPYFPQYNTWFGQGVVRAREFGSQRVCFSALGFAAVTPESHVWDHFGDTNPCATSPIFRAYSTYVAGRWGLAKAGPRAFRMDMCRESMGRKIKEGGKKVEVPPTPVGGAPLTFALPDWVFTEPTQEQPVPGFTRIPIEGQGGDSCKPYVRIVYVARKTKPFSPTPVVNRVVANEGELFAAIGAAAKEVGADVDVIEADFAKMKYADQVRLTRSASILIGMHGAGLVHGLDLADADECGGSTGVLEMFPQPNTEKGIRNMNVQVGRNYWTWHNEDPGRETGSGTLVDKEAIRGIVAGALGTIIGQRKACAV